MKKLIALLLAALMIFGMAACGNRDCNSDKRDPGVGGRSPDGNRRGICPRAADPCSRD